MEHVNIIDLIQASKAVQDFVNQITKLDQNWALSVVGLLMQEICDHYNLDLITTYRRLAESAQSVNKEAPARCYRGDHERNN